MTQDELIALRKRILEDVVPLAVDSVDNSPDRFELLLRIVQSGNASANVYQKAYDTARAIEDKDEKLDALMSLVDEIDFELQSDVPETDTADTQPSDQPEQ